MIRVISGGQTGVDQAGWRAARACGLDTGGWMPLGYKTEDGPRPEFAGLYGAREHTSPRYEDRTPLNVQEADATLLVGDLTSRGSKLAYRCFREKAGETRRDPFTILDIRPGWIPVYRMQRTGRINLTADDLADVLRRMAPGVLNVAGNRESAKPGIGAWAEAFLVEVFRHLAGE